MKRMAFTKPFHPSRDGHGCTKVYDKYYFTGDLPIPMNLQDKTRVTTARLISTLLVHDYQGEQQCTRS